MNPAKLEQALSYLPHSKIYAGPEYLHQGVKFIGGYSIILSKDVAYQLVKNSSNMNSKIIDDVSIGIAVKELGIEITNLPEKPWLRLRDLPTFSQKINGTYRESFAFRCKAEIDLPSRFIARRLRIKPIKIRLDGVILHYINYIVNRNRRKELLT